ncbi:MAG: hypothetical protein EZS28_002007 [Streblomastix strix]|uniref:Uncharacterized protein n=1 Tax=Streblomastix strix TaxID=222440 RepID=A0A5J4X628_9EUKA|nr:MAG: hypothetical protein EZS28_002007 [Streblomastix strix]
MPISPRPQQYSESPTLKQTLAILETVSTRYPRGRKEKEPEGKLSKLQQQQRMNIPVQLFKNTFIYDNDNKCSTKSMRSTLENESDIVTIAHVTLNKRYAKLSNNGITIFDNGKWRATSTLIKKIKYVHQTIEKLRIWVQITHLPGIKNEIADALSRLQRAEKDKLKEKIFQQTYLQMNLNGNHRFIFTTLLQSAAKIHANNKKTRRNSN